jgi:hypothetical protein
MKNSINLLWLLSLPLLLFAYGCGENGLFGGGEDPVVPMGEECSGNGSCLFAAVCDNGYCVCPDTTRQIQPGFCWERVAPAMFVTYDAHPDWVDTTVIGIDVEPFDVDWSAVGEFGTQIWGQTIQFYPRFSGGSIGRLWPPEDPGVGADSIWIMPIKVGRNGWDQAYFNDFDWRCTKVFMGRFINRDTIVGKLNFIGCGGPRETPMPAEVANPTHEMTWIRLE